MDLSQSAQLAQELKLSPMVLQSMEILQMNTLELADYLRRTALENPVLEEAEPWQARQTWRDMAARAPWVGDLPEGDAAPGQVDGAADSLALHLGEQLERRNLSAPLLALCQYLIGLLDERGRLDQEDLDDLAAKGVPADLLAQGVTTLQSLDPAGVGARTSTECLLLQLRRLPGDHALAETLCRDHLSLLAKGDESALAQALGVSRKKAAEAARQVRALSPDPLAEFAPAAPVVYLRPDAWVIQEEGQLAQTLEVHPSTVTRALAHKCLQCRQGLFPVSFFFSSGRGEVSARQVQAKLARLIREEDPRHPLSDQALAQRLAEEGVSAARRTVAKYRQALGLPPAHGRRR